MRIISVANQKGGCGKTTTAVNMSAALGSLGRRVLLLDLDPQAHATLGVGCRPENYDRTVYNVLADPYFSAANAVVETETVGVDLMPSNILLSGAEHKLAVEHGREYFLKNKLAELSDRYDFCVIDCSPSLNLMTLNALAASREVVIPVQVHYYALEGLKQLLETVDIVKQRFNSELSILGVLLTFVETRTLLSRQVEQQMRDFFGELVFKTVIHRTVRLAEAPSAGISVLTYAPSPGVLRIM